MIHTMLDFDFLRNEDGEVTQQMGIWADLDKLLVLGSVQMNLHCTHLIAVLQSARTEYKHFQYAFSDLNWF